MSVAAQVYWVNNDNTLEVLGLQNELTGVYLNNASVSVTLKDHVTGTEIDGESWPLSLDYVPESDGNYRATLAYDLVLTDGQLMLATVVADGGFGLHAEWDIPVEVQARDH